MYATPFDPSTDQRYALPDEIRKNLDRLAKIAERARAYSIEVFPLMLTIHHPEGNFTLPSRYRQQLNLDGSVRQGFVCFRDPVRQNELVDAVAHAAGCGFQRIAFDDDLRDAFCYCDEHLQEFDGFQGRGRDEVAEILNSVLEHPEHELLRRSWYDYKYQGMSAFAKRIRSAVDAVNPSCRIGIFTSAKRSQDFSGRGMVSWAKQFHTETAPVFVRLAGECYADDLASLVRGVGWHQYTHDLLPAEWERMLEITATVRIGYRSPGAVKLETKAVLASTGVANVHWAWADELEELGLANEISVAQTEFDTIAQQSQGTAVSSSSLAMFIGEQLGAYTPPATSQMYGATHDPMSIYGLVASLGLPIRCVSQLAQDHVAVICAAYIGREMIQTLDDYVRQGGVAILDATAARCYRCYGGEAKFDVVGPRASFAYEVGPTGGTEHLIARCPPETVFPIQAETAIAVWTGFDAKDQGLGATCLITAHGRGKLIVVGLDLSQTGTRLLVPNWRERLLSMLREAGVELPLFWQGPAGVQLIDHGERAALVNYNPNPVTGAVHDRGGDRLPVTLKAMDVQFVELGR